MTKPAIEVKNLSKSYIINHKDRASYKTIKDDFTSLVKRPFNKLENHEEKFWALKDVSFEVEPGEIFGVIGRNGSGKSTLLKILSRIVQPTSGSVTMRGRVAGLLEVGTGFHPELTGRENVFFNGSMLGMSKKEIEKKFDEIVAFSEVEKFIDTPVKFYSSGMYVRLAFSVAAHLDPDILILDEVLAVGDAAFQEKSLKKIRSTMEGGTTVLFVSHSMGAVQRLCTKAVMLNDGKIELLGDTNTVTSRYSEYMSDYMPAENAAMSWSQSDDKYTNDYFKPEKIYITDENNVSITSPTKNNIDKKIVIEGEVLKESNLLTLGVVVYSSSNTPMFISFPYDGGMKTNYKKGRLQLSCTIPKHLLNEDKYKVSLIGGIHNQYWIFEPGTQTPYVEFIIKGGLSDSDYWKNARDGNMAPILKWETENA